MTKSFHSVQSRPTKSKEVRNQSSHWPVELQTVAGIDVSFLNFKNVGIYLFVKIKEKQQFIEELKIEEIRWPCC